MQRNELTVGSLLYRRQFLITPDTCASASFISWQHLHIGHYHVYAHPDIQLSTVISADANVTITCIGYIIDPNYPEKSNSDILSMVANFGDSIDRISEYLCTISGRFILIISTPKETLLFHDPCGLRTAYYTQYNGQIYVGSQPSIFKEVLNIKQGDRFSSYMTSSYRRDHIEHWIPSGCSLFEEVDHLVPNHYLRFSTLEQIRYWPNRKLPKKQVNEAIIEASDLLEQLMIAANYRFKLAQPLTAGWDSRIILSASKSISNQVFYYTLQYRDLNPKSNDIKIPAKLLHSLGLNHNLIDCRKTAPEVFREIYQHNVLPAHFEDWGEIAYGMFDMYPQDRVCVKGNCSEIVRCFYYKYGKHGPITSPDQIIALEDGWNTIPFIKEGISNWYDQASEVVAETGIDILDLFYWEHRMGSWQAQSQLEWDIVQETYTPFNHRGLLELMLGIPTDLRSAPHYSLYNMMCKHMWSDVMKQPVNPPTVRQRLINIMGKIGIYEKVKSLYQHTLRSNA